ncbi:MAG: helix-turn-helix transcriptional regulator [Paracoccaceae bacterium]|nr:MAG: helix-turn-helix transcriptional regulator [Paracoccaceae bacterium]
MPPESTPETDAIALLDRIGRGDVMAAECPSRAILQHLTSRWGVLVMVALSTGTHRFSALRRRIGGVSERMLAQTLQVLEADGMVRRVAHQVVPPHVDYSLTPLGREAAERVLALAGWVEVKLPEILGDRAAA